MHRQAGQALVSVLAVTLVMQLTASAFLSRMHSEQRLAGRSARSIASLYLAEGALHQALWALEQAPPVLSGTDTEGVRPVDAPGTGASAVEGIEHLPGGLISIVVRGEVGGAVRRLKALARVGPVALAYGLYGQRSAGFNGGARTYVIPCRAGQQRCRRGGHIAIGGTLWFHSTRVTLNSFSAAELELRGGPVIDHALLGPAAIAEPSLGAIDVVLADKAQLRIGLQHPPVGIDDLRARIRGVGIGEMRIRAPIVMPSVDTLYFRKLAEMNKANEAINAAAAGAGRTPSLRSKTSSFYTAAEFSDVLGFSKERPMRTLHGVVFVDGDVTLEGGARLVIMDGALIARGNIDIDPGARLEVYHRDAARVLPAIIALGPRTIRIADDAVLIADGLVLAEGSVLVLGGALDVIGAVISNDFLNRDGTAVIRYDSAVLSTAGLHGVGKRLGELVSWQELP